MKCLVLGQSGSGKSQLAEQAADHIGGVWIYAATMIISDQETEKKAVKHQKRRNPKIFHTIETPASIMKTLNTSLGPRLTQGNLLIECLSNLLANEMFAKGAAYDIEVGIFQEIIQLSEIVSNLIIVSNDIFCDSTCYDSWSEDYVKKLAWLNINLAQISDIVVEAVCNIPVFHKGGEKRCFTSHFL